MKFKSKVFTLRPGEEIVWGGGFLLFVYRGNHAISLSLLPNGGTRFRQIERWWGLLVILMGRMFQRMFELTKQGYNQMNVALKRRVESDLKADQD
jgi:hypothetical protein